MRTFLFLLLLVSISFASMLKFENYQTTILLKKDQTPVPITLSISLQGRYIENSRVELMDVIESTVGSFWAEVLVTGEGKRRFKKILIESAQKVYSIEIDNVYLYNIRIESCDLVRLKELFNSVRQ